MTTSEKVAHLKGVLEGMEYDTSTKEGKIFSEILNIREDIAVDVDALTDDVDSLYDFTDELDENLCDVEETVFGEDYYDDEDDFDDEELPDYCEGCEEDCSTCGQES